jgi:hypothetical protein
MITTCKRGKLEQVVSTYFALTGKDRIVKQRCVKRGRGADNWGGVCDSRTRSIWVRVERQVDDEGIFEKRMVLIESWCSGSRPMRRGSSCWSLLLEIQHVRRSILSHTASMSQAVVP